MDFVMTSHEALDKSDIVQVGSHCQVLRSDFFLRRLFLNRFLNNFQVVGELRDQLNEKSFDLEVIDLFLFTLFILHLEMVLLLPEQCKK